MKKIICIGELALNMVLDSTGQPLASLPGSRVANAAVMLGRAGLPVLMASEAAADPVGNLVVKSLTDAGVDVSAVDRFTEGHSPLNVFVESADRAGQVAITRYDNYPPECFDIVWPRINEDDVVLYGGFYVLDSRMRARMQKFLEYAAERKAIMVYLPGFLPQLAPRITRVMPQILENLEIAQIVVARTADLRLIFGAADSHDGYRNHIDFYCRSLVAVDTADDEITYFSGKESTETQAADINTGSMLWNAGVAAGIAAAIYAGEYTVASFDPADAATRQALVGTAVEWGRRAVAGMRFPELGF